MQNATPVRVTMKGVMIFLGAMLLACGVVAISLVRALRDAKGFMAAA